MIFLRFFQSGGTDFANLVEGYLRQPAGYN